MNAPSLTLRPAQIVFSFWIALFALVLVDGYALNLVSLPADPTVIFIAVLIEMLLLARGLLLYHPRWDGAPLEFAGFLISVVVVGIYFLVPALPTFLPPSFSVDPANHLAFVNSTFATGQIVSDYPGGPALIGALVAHWLGEPSLRVIHPLAALWIALTAGGIFGIACAALPDRRVYKIVALCAPFALFVPWNYFAGALIGSEYFWTQVAAQLFLIAFVWFQSAYRDSRHVFWAVGMALCLIAISVSFQLWLAVPAAMFGLALVAEWRARASRRQTLTTGLVVVGIPSLFWVALFVAGSRFIPNTARLSAAGAIPMPSFDALGGAYLLLPLLGAVLLLRGGARGWVVRLFIALAAAQCVFAIAANVWLGISTYWVGKTFYLLALPLALGAVIPLARAVEYIEHFAPRGWASAATFAVASVIFGAGLFALFPAPAFSPLSESDIQVALWAKEKLATGHINLIGRKSLVAQWLGVGIWGERLPDDLLVDMATLGPKTFEEWRGDPAWGEYLFVSSEQHLPLDGALQTLYRRGDSMIVAKPANAAPAVDAAMPTAQFGDALALLDYNLPRATFRAGDVISFTARIQAQRVPAHQVVWRVQLRDRSHNAAAEARRDPFDNKFPLQRWPDGNVIQQSFALSLPLDLRAGLYDLQLGLYYVGSGAPLSYRSADGGTDDALTLGQIKIELPSATTHELGAVTRVAAKLGDALSLLGYRLSRKSPLHPGESLKIYLYWQSVAVTSKDFTAFVHLLDPAGAVRAQSDAAPRDGNYPTSIWSVGEIVIDPRTLVLPPDASPGEYQIEVGMYEWPSLLRLPVTDANSRNQGDHIILPDRIRVIRP